MELTEDKSLSQNHVYNILFQILHVFIQCAALITRHHAISLSPRDRLARRFVQKWTVILKAWGSILRPGSYFGALDIYFQVHYRVRSFFICLPSSRGLPLVGELEDETWSPTTLSTQQPGETTDFRSPSEPTYIHT